MWNGKGRGEGAGYPRAPRAERCSFFTYDQRATTGERKGGRLQNRLYDYVSAAAARPNGLAMNSARPSAVASRPALTTASRPLRSASSSGLGSGADPPGLCAPSPLSMRRTAAMLAVRVIVSGAPAVGQGLSSHCPPSVKVAIVGGSGAASRGVQWRPLPGAPPGGGLAQRCTPRPRAASVHAGALRAV